MLATLLVAAIISSVLASQPPPDWLVETITDPVLFTQSDDGNSFILSNGLISRTFVTQPDFGTIGFYSLSASQSIQRSVYPEGSITIDGIAYNISGLGQSSDYYGILNVTADSGLSYNPNAWHFSYFATSPPTATVPWTPGTRHSPSNVSWPPLGLHLEVHFMAPENAPSQHQTIDLVVHYEMYIGIPLISKWVTAVQTDSNAEDCIIDSIVTEYLAVNHQYAPWDFSALPSPWSYGSGAAGSNLYIETDQAHGTQINWITDPHSVNDWGASEINFEATYTVGPGAFISSVVSETGLGNFTSFRTLELVTDSVDPERVGLSRHRMTRLLAPWTMENPVFFHLVLDSPKPFRYLVDQMAQVGFEMVIFSFDTGFRFLFEANSLEFMKTIRDDVEYARGLGIEVGGYDLICEARGYGGYGGNVGDQFDVVQSNGQLYSDACFASGWLDKLNGITFDFLNFTGMSMMELDGPYGGPTCYSTNHTHHHNAADSVYRQTQLQGQYMTNLRKNNVFINQPDMYFYQGGSKAAMGYNEDQYSLPRWEDLTVSRQGMYDDLYHFIPTQGWMQVPLVDYHSGGEKARFYPLSKNIVDYEWALAQYLGAGVAACYRGYELYDNNETEAVVTKWVSFYKNYRDILISDVIHLRRADLLDYDGFMHVNPTLQNRALAMIFNPTQQTISKNITLPLYYAGIREQAWIQQEDNNPILYNLIDLFNAQVLLQMQPMSITWFVVQATPTQ